MNREEYESKVSALEAEGMTRSDAQGIVDMEEFALEPVTASQIAQEELEREQREKIADKHAAPLKGSAGDLTADMFGGGETPLFNEPMNAPCHCGNPDAYWEGDPCGRRECACRSCHQARKKSEGGGR